jgi:NhaP-type Na+/H+ or K+/H+ antiporter
MREKRETRTDDPAENVGVALRKRLSEFRSYSSNKIIATAIAAAFALTCIRVLIIARIYGYCAPDSDQGAQSMVLTWFTLSAGLVPLFLALTHQLQVLESGFGSLAGLGLGLIYGLFTGEIITGGVCGACVGALTGYVLGRKGIRPFRNEARQTKVFFGTVAGAYAFLAIGGFMKPVPLVPVGEARLASERERLQQRLMSSGGSLPPPSSSRPELNPRSKEVIAKYRREHGFGTNAERNVRAMLEASEEYERKLRE